MSKLLARDPSLIQRMELDLTTKAQAGMVAAGVPTNVYQIFSLDDLANKQQSDICNSTAIGVGWQRASTSSGDSGTNHGTASTSKPRMVDFYFQIVLASPANLNCLQEYTPTGLMGILLFSILGTMIDGDAGSRTWEFVRMDSVPSESDETMLYYSQVWRAAMPIVGNLKT